MKMIAMVLTLLSSSAFASPNIYTVKIDLSINGKFDSSYSMTVQGGRSGTIGVSTGKDGKLKDGSFIEVVADEGTVQNHQGILINTKVGLIDENGEKVILAAPQVLTKADSPAQVTVSAKNGDTLSLTVTAHRRAL